MLPRWAIMLVMLSAGLARAAAGEPPMQISLDGRWEFRFAPDERGTAEKWSAPGAGGFDRTLDVPGCWDAQGVGEPTDKMRHNAIGVGWYRRTFSIPPEWRGRRLWLCVGGVHRSAHVY